MEHITPSERARRALREAGYMRGGKIKGGSAKKNPGRQKRAAGGAIEDENADTVKSSIDRPAASRHAGGDQRLNERHLPGDGEPSGRADGGAVDEGYEGSRSALERVKDQTSEPQRTAKTYERTARADGGGIDTPVRARGGSTGKSGNKGGGKGGIGKVNIVIAHPGGGPAGGPGASPIVPPGGGGAPVHPPMAPPMAAPPPRPPMMPGTGAPPMPPMPPGGGGPGPGGPPMAPPPGGMPMRPPQGIRHGGSVRHA